MPDKEQHYLRTVQHCRSDEQHGNFANQFYKILNANRAFAGVIYQFRVISINSLGESIPSDVATSMSL